MIFALSNVSLAITDLGEFNYWYSDSSYIGFHDPSNLKVYAQTDPDFGMSNSNFSAIINHAVTAWSGFVGTTSGATSSNYDVGIYGISREQADYLNYPGNVDGATGIVSSSLYAYAGTKKVRKVDKAKVYLIWDSVGADENVKTSTYTLTTWKGVTAHEYGHAIGYYGHNPYSSTLMYYSSTATTPQSKDKLHMGNVY